MGGGGDGEQQPQQRRDDDGDDDRWQRMAAGPADRPEPERRVATTRERRSDDSADARADAPTATRDGGKRACARNARQRIVWHIEREAVKDLRGGAAEEHKAE